MSGIKLITDTQSDWQQGTLDGVVATAAGDLELAAEFSDDFDRTTLGPDWEIAPDTEGSVQLQNGELVLTGGSSRRMWVRTTRTFEAHSIVFRARRDSADEGSDVGLAFNWDGNLQPSGAGEPLNGYRLYWRVWEDPSPLRISRYDNGVQTILASIEFPPDYNEHEFAVLIEDGVIRVFVDGVQMLQANDSTYTSGYIGLTSREDREDGNRRGRYNWIVVNRETLGSRVSPVLDLSPVGTAAGSAISWNASIPGVVLGGSGIHSGRIAWSEGTNFPDPKPSYLPADKFSWMVEGQIIIPADGTYVFGLDSDDASDLFIDGRLVVSWYGNHGTAGSGGVPDFSSHNGAIALTAGLHTIRVRMVQGTGGSGVAVGWKKPGDASFSIIPAEQFENLQYKWFSTEGLYDKIGHPTTTEVMDYFFNEPDVTVETDLSLDGGQTWQGWQQTTNGGAIPGVTPGMDLSNARLQTRVTLSTANIMVTPQLHSLTVAVPVAGSASAPVFVQVGVSRGVASPARVSVGLAKAVSGPVLVQAGLAKATARDLRVYVVAVSRRVPASRHIRARLHIGRPDGATWQDVTDYLASARVSLGDVRALGTGSEGVDERVRMATFVLRQDRAPGGPSLSPRDRTSPWNQWDEKYAPLIWPRRQVLFDCCVESIGDVPPSQHETRRWAERVGFGDGATLAFQLDHWPVESGSEVVYVNGVAQQRGTDYTIDYATGQVTFATAPPAGLPITADYTYWLPIFEGFIDDWRTDGPTVEFNCRDLAAVLQDAYIESAHTYGSAEGTPLEEVIQQILDDNLGAGAVQLYCPRPPGFAVRPYNVEYQSVWDAVQSAVSKTIGWYLGYWFDPITNRFRLTLLEPPRNKTAADADWELDYRDDIYVDDLGGSIADVRNVVRITFRNAATGKRETITVEDSASIAEYGRRAMQIEEADASLINTPEEAMALAVAAVADLKDQHATANLELPFMPALNVMDGVVVRDDRVSSEPDFFAVESVEHTLDFDGGRFRTTAVCSGRVVGAHTRWMEMQTRPGAQQPTRMVSADAVEVTQAQPPQPVGVFANGTLAGIEVFVPAPSIRNWRLTRVRLKTTPGGIAIDTQESRGTRFMFTNVVPGATYYADAQYEDTELQTGPWSEEVSVIAGGLTSGIIVMWSGSIDQIPVGWALCDGRTYQTPDGRLVTTPDLRDRFIVGAGLSYQVGERGGAAQVTLTIDQIPPHSHTYTVPDFLSGRVAGRNDGGSRSTGTTSTVGGGKPHENRPPYYALCFIMKLW